MLAQAGRPTAPARPRRPLNVFVPHAADLFTDNRPHGDGLVAYEVASRLAARGYHVHAAAPRVDLHRPTPPTLHVYDLGVPDAEKFAGRLRYMLRLRKLWSRLRRRVAFDVVHQLNPVYTGMSLALEPLRIPLVLGSYVGDWPAGADLEGTDVDIESSRRKRSIAFLQQRRAARLLVTTPAAAESRLVDAPWARAKTIVLPHGIDPAPYAAAPQEDVPPMVLFLGGLERRKGIYTMLDAFERVRAVVPGVRLIIAGDGSQRGEVWERIEKSSAAIEIVGRVGRDMVPLLMSRAAVYCMPSFGEPFGMSLLEAMASSRPVVTTDLAGPAHIVDAEGGFRVKPGDDRALAEAIVDLLGDSDRRRAMGRHNRERVKEIYAWDAVIDRLEDVYADLATSPR